METVSNLEEKIKKKKTLCKKKKDAQALLLATAYPSVFASVVSILMLEFASPSTSTLSIPIPGSASPFGSNVSMSVLASLALVPGVLALLSLSDIFVPMPILSALLSLSGVSLPRFGLSPAFSYMVFSANTNAYSKKTKTRSMEQNN